MPDGQTGIVGQCKLKVDEQFSNLSLFQRAFWRILFGILGAVLAAVIVFLLFHAVSLLADLLDASRFNLRVPVVLFFMPLVGFIYGWRRADVLQTYFSLLLRKSIYFRIFVFGTLFYSVSLSAFIEIFEPARFYNGLDFGRFRWFEFRGRYGDFVRLIFFPPALLGLGLLTLKRINPK